MQIDEDETVGLHEGARLLGIGLTKMKTLVQLGVIPHWHHGRKVLMCREDVIAYRDRAIEQHMVTHRPKILRDSHRRSEGKPVFVQ